MEQDKPFRQQTPITGQPLTPSRLHRGGVNPDPMTPRPPYEPAPLGIPYPQRYGLVPRKKRK